MTLLLFLSSLKQLVYQAALSFILWNCKACHGMFVFTRLARVEFLPWVWAAIAN